MSEKNGPERFGFGRILQLFNLLFSKIFAAASFVFSGWSPPPWLEWISKTLKVFLSAQFTKLAELRHRNKPAYWSVVYCAWVRRLVVVTESIGGNIGHQRRTR